MYSTSTTLMQSCLVGGASQNAEALQRSDPQSTDGPVCLKGRGMGEENWFRVRRKMTFQRRIRKRRSVYVLFVALSA